jgi:hypothetical protein
MYNDIDVLMNTLLLEYWELIEEVTQIPPERWDAEKKDDIEAWAMSVIERFGGNAELAQHAVHAVAHVAAECTKEGITAEQKIKRSAFNF